MNLRPTPSNYTLPALPHLSRAEGIVFYLLVMIFDYLHPKFAAYIEAMETRDRILLLIQRTERVHRYWKPGNGFDFKAHQFHAKLLQPVLPPFASEGFEPRRGTGSWTTLAHSPHIRTRTRTRDPPHAHRAFTAYPASDRPIRGRTCCQNPLLRALPPLSPRGPPPKPLTCETSAYSPCLSLLIPCRASAPS